MSDLEAVADWVEAHPGCRYHEVAEALGITEDEAMDGGIVWAARTTAPIEDSALRMPRGDVTHHRGRIRRVAR